MPAQLLVVAINWYGPYNTLNEARDQGEKNNIGEFLYVAFETGVDARSYVGLSSDISTRLKSSHHVLGAWIEKPFEIWIGIICSQVEPGRKPSDSPAYHSAILHFVEHMIVYFVETSENKKKLAGPPKRSGAIFNRWFGPSSPWQRHSLRPHPNWPDLIEYEEAEFIGRKVYFCDRIETINISLL